MELLEDILNPYHNYALLAFIRVFNDLPEGESFTKRELRTKIETMLADASWCSADLIEELIKEAINQDFLREREDGQYEKVSSTRFWLSISRQEKIYLKNLLRTPYARLFLEESTITKLLDALSDTPDMAYLQHIEFGRVSPDAVFCDDEIAAFRGLIQAIQEKRMIRFDNFAHNGTVYHNTAFLVKMEFSVIRRHFWLSLWNPERKRPYKADISRIQKLEILEPIPPEEYTAVMNMMEMRKEKEPIVMEIKNELQAIERASLMFSSYQKKVTSLDKNTLCMSVYYYTFDKDELLESILSFGSRIRVLEPASIVDEIRDRLRRAFAQMEA